MRRLDKFIQENRDQFDDAEPLAGHFERFAARMEQETVIKKRRIPLMMVLRIAAVFLLLLTATLFVFDVVSKSKRNSYGNSSEEASLNPELQNALIYYENRTSDKLIEFKRLACCGEQQVRLTNMVNGELNALDENSLELKQILSKNPNNEAVQAALIKNHQMKEEVVENVIKQLKERQ